MVVRKVKDWRDKGPAGWTRGERNAAWIERYCRVPEGKDRGKRVRLREWQVQELRDMYDTPTSVYIVTFGRKNGKTALIAFIVLLHLCGPEADPGSEIVSGARSKDQAAMVFRYARKCVAMDPDLSRIVSVHKTHKELECKQLDTSYKALSADAETNLGRSPLVAIHDELGQVKGPKDDFFEAIDTAQGAHDNPRTFIISTQAPNPGDLLSMMIDDALSGKDPTIKVSIYSAPEDMDPFSEEALKAANPAYGDFLNADYVRGLAEKARRMPSRENAFRNLILNQRVNMVNPLLSRTAWEACGGRPAPLEGKVYLALDLAAIHDLAAATAVCLGPDGTIPVHCDFFTPLKGLSERADRDREPYDVWAREGFLQTTPGAAIDYDWVAAYLRDKYEGYDVAGLWYDRWRMDVFKAAMERVGWVVPIFPFGQGFKDMTPAVQELETRVTEAQLRHGMNPVLTMCARNAVAVRDPAGNVKLDKSKATGRIDGLVSLTMALGGMAAGDKREAPKAYQMLFV